MYSHLLGEWLAVILNILRTDIPTRGQHKAVLFDLGESRTLAEARHILVFASILLATPRVIGACNLLNVLIGQFPVDTVNQGAHFTGVNE